ncbi:MAG: pirin family protein [Akkermansiaceae bacterium]|jgi:redox-sensitive bicupin YhaK (pirin superfamily)|nr:pirin family protein [Akkermansiaceae bacterium]
MTANHTLRIRRAGERGHANHGWLDSWHTFSFANYYDPAHMGFRSLRVINDDRVAPGGGFPNHPHRDMEIFSYVLEGSLAHQDSMGNKRELKPGEIQLMRAGSGVLHSEFNPSATEDVRLLQIWITPSRRGLEPSYTEWTPPAESASKNKLLVISEDGREGSARIAQDASVHLIRATAGDTVSHDLAAGRGVWLHVIRGRALACGVTLEPGDAASIEEPATFEIKAGPDGLEALLFDLR